MTMDFNAMREMQAKQQRLGEVMTEAAKEYKFPLKDVRLDWLLLALKLLEYGSPLTTGLPPEDFKSLAAIDLTNSDIPFLSLFQFGALCNNVEARTAKELGYTLPEYAALLTETAQYAKIWRVENAELMKKVQAAFETVEAAKRTALPMKAVKAEA